MTGWAAFARTRDEAEATMTSLIQSGSAPE
jgi:hypothetical protein